MLFENLNLHQGEYIASIIDVTTVTTDNGQMALQVFWHIDLFGQRVAVANNFFSLSCNNGVQCVTEHLKDSKEYHEVIRLTSDGDVYYFEVSDDGEITQLFAVSECVFLEETLLDEDASEYDVDFDALAIL